MEKHIPILNYKWWLLVSHFKRKFRFIKCLICKVLSPVGPSKKHKYSVKSDIRLFFLLFCTFYDFSCSILPDHSGSLSNQNNNRGLFRWTEKTLYSINALRFCFLFRNVTSEHVYSKTLNRGKLLLLFSMVKKNKQIKVYGWTTVLSNMSWRQMLF